MTHDADAASDGPIVVHVDPRLKDLVPGFLANRRKDVESMRQAVAKGDFEAVRITGHSLKGAGGGYGFDRITELGRDIELGARERDAERIGRAVTELSGYLNRVQVADKGGAPAKAPAKALILCVDDDPDTRKLTERLLALDGFDAVTADGGHAALKLLETSTPDLILLDAMMPGMDGYEFCAWLQKKGKLSYLPVIFVTALGDEQNKARALAAGAVDYIVKPVQRESLRQAITTHLKTVKKWETLRQEPAAEPADRDRRPDFVRFKKHLIGRLDLKADLQEALLKAPPGQFYLAFAKAGLDGRSVARQIAEFLKVPYCPRINPEDIQLGVLPAPFCKSNSVVAIKEPFGEKVFVLSNPFDWQMQDVIKQHRTHKIQVTEPENIAALFATGEAKPAAKAAPTQDAAWADADTILKMLDAENLESSARADVKESEEIKEDDSGIVRLANKIIIDAYRQEASDIHIEPYADEDTEVRLRIDGLCQEYRLDGKPIPRKFARALVSRIKIMANLDIAEKRLPQDGKIKFKHFGPLDIELRVATLPTAQGQEDVVMRILTASKPMLLDRIGIAGRNLELFKGILSAPYGIVLCVGPTGSGKTTTLHSALGYLNTSDCKIWTAEDPVEITQRRLRQMQVAPKIGLTFERALRAFLRADPDVIMVGEMRDLETAQAAIEASLTGHLVFSTLHTNTAPETVTRLIDMGIDPFTFGDSLLGVLAQRLCRRLCADCKEKYRPGAEEWSALIASYGGAAAWSSHAMPEKPVEIYREKRCDTCRQQGYKGRLALHEFMVINDDLRGLIYKKSFATQLREAAVRDGMISLMQDGIGKVLRGETTLNQVRTVCAV